MKRVFLSSAIISVFLLSCGNTDHTSVQPDAKQADSAGPGASLQPETPANNADGSDTATRSVAALEKQYGLVPSDPALAYDLAWEYSARGNTRALTLADSLVRTHAPEVEKAYYIKANYFSQINNVPEAIKNYDAAITANYQFLDAYLDKGQLLFREKKYEQALKTFAIGQKVSPGTAEFYYWVAKTQEALGDKADAKMNYERAYALNKNLTEAKAAAERL
jgi:tetratricopeptide (TPR) repeat protein